MHIVVKADPVQRDEFMSKPISDRVKITWFASETFIPEADAYFDLLYEEQGYGFATITNKPVFVNAVIDTGNTLPKNCIRINAWHGFLNREIIELAETLSIKDFPVGAILEEMGWKYQMVPDTPGMIAARVIAMIINEAYFGLGEEISTKAEIDTAMKLGTNYPYGPFEWSEKIGLKKIYLLLKKLSEEDRRYAVAPALENEILIA
jgi:3-hydroxybutyryl-CoA dehydrogenase